LKLLDEGMIMLFPQQNLYRTCEDLSGFWEFQRDTADQGRANKWFQGLPKPIWIAVPSSWNEQFIDTPNDFGPAWYQLRFEHDAAAPNRRYVLRFGSVNYCADVWLNAEYLGGHEGGHLPFEFDITHQMQRGENLLVVRVDAQLSPLRVPPGNVPETLNTGLIKSYPPTKYDFFAYCGIHRPVKLYSTHVQHIEALSVTTELAGTTGVVHIGAQAAGGTAAQFTLSRGDHTYSKRVQIEAAQASVVLDVPNAQLWDIGEPNLYRLTTEIISGDEIVDLYHLDIGIRTVAVQGNALLLNNKPVFLCGFGRHEDFPIIGRGLPYAVMIKDTALMQWVGANSFRTSHYPYAEEILDLADKTGILVIDETPAVGLYFSDDGVAARLETCRSQVREMIARDRNHPSVIMWSLANEPDSDVPAAKTFFLNLYQLARSLDQTRPITLVSHRGVNEEAFEFLDLICLNRYYGWYTHEGRIAEGITALSDELDALYERFHKPIILSEFGADAVPGHHAIPEEMFSEEYQAELIERTITLLNTKAYVTGQHIWNLCDFKTGQGYQRVNGYNYKGVFTRDRRPKLAAHRLRQLWEQPALQPPSSTPGEPMTP
jgi:beta-glucuronidase